jgi:hypothetical protein
MASKPRRTITVPSEQGNFAIPTGIDAQSGSAGSGDGSQSGSLVQRGHRPVKEYYLYDSELRELKRTGALTTVLFAAGSALIGFVINTHLALIFADKLPDDVKIQWTTYRDVAVIGAVIFYFFGILLALSGYNEVERIKADTQHGTEKYVPKSRYKVGFWALAFLAAVLVGSLGGFAWR